jgi:RNA polymerase sigma factor (sigma-70 family)
MPESDDITRLKQYVEGDESAFAVLVERYVHLVYSTALRQVGNPSQAEEITQAVFIILTQKAKSLGPRTILSGWLYQAARLAAANFLRSEIRRQKREQEAYMESLLNEPTPNLWQQIAPLLDDAMGHLSEKDRNVVVSRFFQNQSAAEIGDALGIDSAAAQKRITRAVGRLKKFFAKRSVTHSVELITGAISANSVQAAPVALAKTVTAVALAKGAAASGSILTLVKATLIAMKTKTIVATIAATAVVLGTGTYLVFQSKAPHASTTPSDTVPIKFANDSFATNADDRFVVDIDPNVRRTTNSAPAGHIKSLVKPTSSGSAEFLATTTGTNRWLAASRNVRYHVTKNSSLLGKRIRISGWVKTRDVINWAGATMLVVDKDGHIFADDDMPDRPIHGTTDWQQIEFVTDVPNEPCLIYFAPTLYGTGEMWCDDFQIDVPPADTPITDDRIWHVWSPNPNDYSETTDYNVTHNGHPTLCIAYVPYGAAPQGSWMWWGEDIRNPDKYAGHTVRMTVWTKSEGIADHVRPNLRPKGPNFKLLAQDKQVDGHPIRGTTDWTQHTIICLIPKETQCLDTGFAFHGSGKVWIDMDSLKYEIVK